MNFFVFSLTPFVVLGKNTAKACAEPPGAEALVWELSVNLATFRLFFFFHDTAEKTDVLGSFQRS